MPAEYRAIWSTPGGGTGYTVFHFTVAGTGAAAQQIADDTRAYMDAIKGFFPDEITITFDSEVLDLGEDGALLAVWAVTPPASVAGINASTYNRAAGLRVDWGTGVIVGRRRLTGRTYLVPAGSSVFDAGGLVTAGNITASQTAAANFIAATSANRPLRVWSRTHATSAVVTNASTPSKGAILTGRRD